MSANVHWPGQVERVDMNLEQVTAVASVARSEVFRAFNAREPLSAAEIATAIGKSAQTVRYHINELLKVGLIIAVETRKRRSRIEEAYVHKGVENYSLGPPYPPGYAEQMIRGFQAILRNMARERSAMVRLHDVDPGLQDFSLYRYSTIRMTRTQARKVRDRLRATLAEIAKTDDPNGVRVNVSVYMSTTLGASRVLYEEATGRPLEPDDEDDA